MINIIPAIDLIDGKCVRLTKGDYNTQKVYNENPTEVAKYFEGFGFKRLHLVDLDGAKAGRIINNKVLENIASKTSLLVDFGGGIKTETDLNIVFECGAQMVTLGSLAVKNKELVDQWLARYGADKIIVGADSKDQKISISGWLEDSTIDLFFFIDNYLHSGYKHFLCTDISKDGMMQGSAIGLYKEIVQRFPHCKLIASGGVSSVAEIEELNDANVDAVVIGKAFYEGLIKPEELKKFIN